MINRRNAFLGWLAWKVGKRVLKRKARTAVPAVDSDTRRPNRPAIVAAVAALGGLLWYWRRGKNGEDETPPEAL